MILKIIRRTVLTIVLFVVYLISTVPVGLFLYSLKSDILGINVFTKTGFHAYLQCLQEQAYKIEMGQEKLLSKEDAYEREIEEKKLQPKNDKPRIIE